MDQQTADSIQRRLFEVLPLDPDVSTTRFQRQQLAGRFDIVAPALPQPEQWDVWHEDGSSCAAARILAEQCFIVVSVDLEKLEDADGRPPVVVSRGVDPLRDGVALWVGDLTLGRRERGTITHWWFGRTGDEFTVEGFVSDEGDPDQSELLARGIAADLGW
jgi:hypothetical protein